MILSGEAEAREFCAARAEPGSIARLVSFADMLIEENGRQNLIAKASETDLWLRHFADSAQLLDHVPRETAPWLDLGTGAGFPGLVVAALRPGIECILVESRRKRIDFLTEVINALDLPNCSVFGGRLEAMNSLSAGVISARAFAPLGKLLDLSSRFSTRDTFWLLPKGRSARQELANLPRKQRDMFHVEQSVTDTEAGILIGKGRPV